MISSMRRLPTWLLGLLLVLWAVPALAQDPPVDPHAGHDHGTPSSVAPVTEPRTRDWPAEAKGLLARLPIQDGGRVKPLSTFAAFKLLQLNGRRTLTLDDKDKTKITSMDWFLDLVFRPRVAIGQRCFVVDEGKALDAIGLHVEGRKRRDRFSYAELAPYYDEIVKLATEYEKLEAKDRSPLQGQLVTLARNLRDYERLAGLSALADVKIEITGAPRYEAIFEGLSTVTLADLLTHGPAVARLTQEVVEAAGDGAVQSDPADPGALDMQVAFRVQRSVQLARQFGSELLLFPPLGSADDAPRYLSAGDLTMAAFAPDANVEPQIGLLREFEGLAHSIDDDDRFLAHAKGLYAGSTELADRRGESSAVSLEVAYYRADFVYRSLLIYLLSFLLCAVSWIWPKRWLTRAVVAAVIGATLYLTIGIVLRCVIRERPPVSTLYETILFITGTGVIFTLVTEWLVPKRVALSLSSLLGTAGMFLAYKYEIDKGVDTMPTLVAVLDTNFWLATHVTSVTIGYAAGLFAGAMGHVYVLGKSFGLKRNDPGFYKAVGRMTYGLIAFGLLFSLIGTVLGGIWANDSWGRFWGWDPKENGALMIVLMNIIILHARMGGYVRDFGVAMLSVLGAAVVAFSWWHVNLLGVGLHAYGFTANVKNVLFGFYGIEVFVLAIGLGSLLMRHQIAKGIAAQGTPPTPPSSPTA